MNVRFAAAEPQAEAIVFTSDAGNVTAVDPTFADQEASREDNVLMQTSGGTELITRSNLLGVEALTASVILVFRLLNQLVPDLRIVLGKAFAVLMLSREIPV